MSTPTTPKTTNSSISNGTKRCHSPFFPNEDISNLENDRLEKEEGVVSPSPSSSSVSSSSCTNSPKMFPIFQKNYRPKETNLLRSVKLEVEKVTPKKRKKTLLTKETNGMTQMVLDAGQKQIGPKYCDECGLLYSPGDFIDEEEHRKAHVRIQNTFQLTLWKDAKILFNYHDGCQIIMVLATDVARVKNRLRDFLAWLDSELGAGYDPSGTRKSERIFLYTSRTTRKNVVRILGCGIMELPDISRMITSPLLVDEKGFTSQNSMEFDSISTTSSPTSQSQSQNDDDDNTTTTVQKNHSNHEVLIGVTRLWTDSGFRRRNIASKMCEIMRFNSGILGYVVPKENFGILEPSDDGRAFMAKFSGGGGAIYTYM
ncbi:N-acetyltransferase ESCO2 [Folsomia candida]|nr:N-acetyltransferase ESCO2 [Folsomia candida]XP_021945751.1 N-acetyltransferase ESCO2 [Folsomia candida]